MARKAWAHGKAIVNGELRYLSVSQIELAGRCLRRWFLDKARGIKDPQSKSQERGEKLHAEAEQYLITGERSHLSTILVRGLHHLPTPGADLAVEADFVPNGLVNAPLRIAGVPMTGYIDVLHARQENYGYEDPRDAVDEPGVIKVIDHKFTNDLRHAKTGPQLVETFQMSGYAELVFTLVPTCERVRLTHNYFPTVGTAISPTALVNRDQVARTWMQATAIAVSMKDAAKEDNPDKVDANLRDCESYGRLCPAADVCSARKRRSLSERVGITTSNRLLQIGTRKPDMNPVPGSLFDVIKKRQADQAGIVPTGIQAGLAPVTAATATVVTVQSEVERLKAAEVVPTPIAAPAPVVTAPAPVAVPAVNPFTQFLATAPKGAVEDSTNIALVKRMLEIAPQHEIGTPVMSGELAQVVAKITGSPLEVGAALGGSGLLGSGAYDGHKFASVVDLAVIVNGMEQLLAQKNAETTAAPVLTPAQIIVGAHVLDAPSTVTDAPSTVAPARAPATDAPPMILPPDAPESKVIMSVVAADGTGAPKRGRGRPPKVKPIDAPPLTPAIVAANVPAAIAPQPTPIAPPVVAITPIAPLSVPVMKTDDSAATTVIAQDTTITLGQGGSIVTNAIKNDGVIQGAALGKASQPDSKAVSFYVDCTVEGLTTTPFMPILRELLDNMTANAGVNPGEDFRLAGRDSKYSFGGWRPILASALASAFEQGFIAAGAYSIEATSGEVMLEAITAMRDIAARTGGVFVRG